MLRNDFVAGMRVPKLVKNGFSSVFAHFCTFEKPVTAEKSRTNVKPRTDPKTQEANENHFTPIRNKHGCTALLSYAQRFEDQS
jgi:hypothetical protein